jgi:hypothetical protein
MCESCFSSCPTPVKQLKTAVISLAVCCGVVILVVILALCRQRTLVRRNRVENQPHTNNGHVSDLIDTDEEFALIRNQLRAKQDQLISLLASTRVIETRIDRIRFELECGPYAASGFAVHRVNYITVSFYRYHADLDSADVHESKSLKHEQVDSKELETSTLSGRRQSTSLIDDQIAEDETRWSDKLEQTWV